MIRSDDIRTTFYTRATDMFEFRVRGSDRNIQCFRPYVGRNDTFRFSEYSETTKKFIIFVGISLCKTNA